SPRSRDPSSAATARQAPAARTSARSSDPPRLEDRQRAYPHRSRSGGRPRRLTHSPPGGRRATACDGGHRHGVGRAGGAGRARRLAVPRRVVTIVEGESLVNDATALVVYRVAIVAVVSGSFSLLDAGGRFALSAAGGIAIGLAVGWLVTQVRSRLDDPRTEITISLMTAYFAYLPAVALGVSGVLAAVTVGIYLGWNSPRLVTSPQTRMQTYGVWEILVFVLNALLFVLLGLQFEGILNSLSGLSAGTLI